MAERELETGIFVPLTLRDLRPAGSHLQVWITSSSPSDTIKKTALAPLVMLFFLHLLYTEIASNIPYETGLLVES